MISTAPDLTRHDDPDVISWVEGKLAEARVEAARAFDRRDALVELRGLIYDFAARANSRTLSARQMRDSPVNAEEEARLRALLDRALPEPEGDL